MQMWVTQRGGHKKELEEYRMMPIAKQVTFFCQAKGGGGKLIKWQSRFHQFGCSCNVLQKESENEGT